MPQIEETEDFFRVRIRSPVAKKMCRTPAWAARVASSVSKGAKVVTCRNAKGKWKVQSVLIATGHGKTKADARRMANRIVKKIEG